MKLTFGSNRSPYAAVHTSVPSSTVSLGPDHPFQVSQDSWVRRVVSFLPSNSYAHLDHSDEIPLAELEEGHQRGSISNNSHQRPQGRTAAEILNQIREGLTPTPEMKKKI